MYRKEKEEGEEGHGKRRAGGLLRCGDNRRGGGGGGARSGVETKIEMGSEEFSLNE